MIIDMKVNDSQTLNLVACVACGHSRLRKFLDLGYQPLANEYLTEPTDRNRYPLSLNLCEVCTHVQLSVSVNPELLFQNYLYVSSTSQTLSDYFLSLRDRILDEFGDSGYLLDIGSNDGSFLSKFYGFTWDTLGVDPAANLASHAAEVGVKTLSAFYDSRTAKLLSDSFNVAVAMNVFAHTPEPFEILKGLSRNVRVGGVAYIQTSQANMLINSEFDTVYHEHISFFNTRSMKALLKRAGWFLQDVSIVSVHGKSYLWKIARTPGQSISVEEREFEEESVGYYNLDFYNSFGHKWDEAVKRVIDQCDLSRRNGYKIAIFGAAAKGNTFFNFSKIVPDYIFDDTPLKIGRFSPLGNLVVTDPNKMTDISEKMLVIIPAWNLKDEIVRRLKMLRQPFRDDLVLTYFPKFELASLQN